ncbi:MAG: DNA adenine methylase [Cuniculiplasma sp.]
MKPTVTPLRYPGGKTWLLDYVKEFIKFHKLELKAIIEPYAGSASVSIGLLREGLVDKAYICEKDPLIVAFWNAVLNQNEEFVEFIQSLEVSLETWLSFKKYLIFDSVHKYNTVELAGAFLFFNRTNYSGIIKGGPLGGKKQQSSYKFDCRFNREKIIEKIQGLHNLEGRLHVAEVDGISFMQRITSGTAENLLFYVDPPYYGAGRELYRYFFTDGDHENLSIFLKKLEHPWLLSYDDAEFIRDLYTNNEKFPVYTDYQSGNLRRNVRELLISNYLIPPLAPSIKEEGRYHRNKTRIANKVI